ncbi:MAG TPA: hypothetical protein VJB14_06655 [Planctomycetota bacterium]|nr:hypothetical protein [Planctomycetota bacterium]
MILSLALLLQEAAVEIEKAAPMARSGGMTARHAVLALMILLPAICSGMVIFGGLRLKSLLKRIPKITSKAHLETLRKESHLHGTMALLIRALLGVANGLFVIDLFVLGGPITDLFYSIIPSLVSIAISLPFRKIEQQIQDLPCATEELREEWVKIRQD